MGTLKNVAAGMGFVHKGEALIAGASRSRAR